MERHSVRYASRGSTGVASAVGQRRRHSSKPRSMRTPAHGPCLNICTLRVRRWVWPWSPGLAIETADLPWTGWTEDAIQVKARARARLGGGQL
jgi:hypothetical protein